MICFTTKIISQAGKMLLDGVSIISDDNVFKAKESTLSAVDFEKFKEEMGKMARTMHRGFFETPGPVKVLI